MGLARVACSYLRVQPQTPWSGKQLLARIQICIGDSLILGGAFGLWVWARMVGA